MKALFVLSLILVQPLYASLDYTRTCGFLNNPENAKEVLEANLAVNRVIYESPMLLATGGTSSNANDEDELYKGCLKYISPLEYLGSKEKLEELEVRAKKIQSMYPEVDLLKELSNTQLCITNDRMEKHADFEHSLVNRSATMLLNGMGEGKHLMKVASYHDSFVNNDMDKKLNILTKELFHNYTWSEHQKTMERTANKVYEITQEFFKGVIDKEEAKMTPAWDDATDWPVPDRW